jgi:hypothetical protein
MRHNFPLADLRSSFCLVFAHAILNKNEIETLSKTLPLTESFKECGSQDVR